MDFAEVADAHSLKYGLLSDGTKFRRMKPHLQMYEYGERMEE
jgi:hypothetical protein